MLIWRSCTGRRCLAFLLMTPNAQSWWKLSNTQARNGSGTYLSNCNTNTLYENTKQNSSHTVYYNDKKHVRTTNDRSGLNWYFRIRILDGRTKNVFPSHQSIEIKLVQFHIIFCNRDCTTNDRFFDTKFFLKSTFYSPVRESLLSSLCFVDLHWFQCGSGSSFLSQCGSWSGYRGTNPMTIRTLVRL